MRRIDGEVYTPLKQHLVQTGSVGKNAKAEHVARVCVDLGISQTAVPVKGTPNRKDFIKQIYQEAYVSLCRQGVLA